MKDPARRLKALPKAVDESLQLVEVGAPAGFKVGLAGLEVVDLEGSVAAGAELDRRLAERPLEAGVGERPPHTPAAVALGSTTSLPEAAPRLSPCPTPPSRRQPASEP